MLVKKMQQLTQIQMQMQIAHHCCVRGFLYMLLVPGIQIASCKQQAPGFAALLQPQMWM